MAANEGAKPSAKQRAPEIGFLSPSTVERALIVLIYAGVVLLACLSIIGTFYGLRGEVARIAPPWRMLLDMYNNLEAAGLGLLAQVFLTVTQYGARVKAASDPRWWLLYLAALAWSLYYNVQAYFGPLVALGLPVLAAGIIIVLADVVPEFAAVKRG